MVLIFQKPRSMASLSAPPSSYMAAFSFFLLATSLLLLHPAHSESDKLEPAVVEEFTEIDFIKELDRVKSHVSILETTLSKKDSSLHEKYNIIATLQAQLKMLKGKQGGEVEASLKKAELKLEEFLSKVTKLEEALEQKEYELQMSKEVVKTLEAAEADLSAKSKKLEKASAEGKKHIEEVEQSLRVAEAVMLRARAEAEARKQELLKLHRHWLPAWAATRLGQLQVAASNHWATYGKPCISQKVVVIQQLATPYVENIKKKVSPTLKQQLEVIKVAVAPHLKTAKTKMVEGYDAAITSLSPYVRKANAVVQPYIKATREIGSPYAEKFTAAIRPHFEQAKKILRPYTLKASRRYRKFLISTTKYHRQIQGSVNASLKRHKILARFAKKEVVWFLASAILLLPVLTILLLFSSVFGSKKPKKPVRGASSHGHKKARRAKLTEK